MTDEPAILVDHLSKSYRTGRSLTDVPIPMGFPGSGGRGKRSERGRRDDFDDDEDDEIIERPNELEEDNEDQEPATGPPTSRIVHALRDVSLEVPRGSRLAVLGAAGSGKSTLLRVIARITPPTKGRVTVRGRVSPPLDLAASFLNPNATGRQNAFIVARLFGLPKRLVEPQLDDIFELAGVPGKIHHRVGTYSNRQYRRLAISIALHLESDVLLIDDRLAMTDEDFGERVRRHLLEATAARGLTILFAATQAETVTAICDEAIWLVDGQLVERGPLAHVARPGPPRPTPRRRAPATGGYETLEPSQRELVHALLSDGRTYEDLADERGVTADSVRAQAQEMLVTVAPDGGRLSPEVREAIGDYMLGQSSPDAVELERMAATPEARVWPVVIAHYLEHLAPSGLPAFPRTPGPGGYDGFVPQADPAAAVLGDYLAIAIGAERAHEAFAAATDKTIWKGGSRVTWADVAEAAGFDHHEAKAVTQRLLAIRSAGGVADPDSMRFSPRVWIAGATLRSADGQPVDMARRSEDLVVETVVDATAGMDGMRVQLMLEARSLDPVELRQPEEFEVAAAGRSRIAARFPAALLDPGEYRARVIVEVNTNGNRLRAELLDAFAFEVIDAGDEPDATQEPALARDVRWHVSP